MDIEPAADRRGMVRYLLRIPARLRVRHQDRQQILPLYTRDISSKGAFFVAGETLCKGTRVEVHLYLPIGRTRHSEVETSGKVIRQDQDGVAVHFDTSYRFLREG